MVIILIIILLLLFVSYYNNKDIKESYRFNNVNRHNRYNPYRHYLRHRYYTGTLPQYYYPSYSTHPELNEQNCRKYYPCEDKN